MNKNISILLATCNGEHYLPAQLDSILEQTNVNWKLLIHDDNSFDNTVDIIKQYQKQNPSKIQFIDDDVSFGNASANFSFLLEYADTEYIMFCDQDDTWLENKIELTFQKMQDMEKSYHDMPLLVHTDLIVADKSLNIISQSYWHYQHLDPSKDLLNRLLVQNSITGCTVMINRKLAKMALPIPEDVIMHDWWLGLVASAFGKIDYLDEATIFYRQHGKNDTGATKFNLQTIWKKMTSLYEIDLQKYILQAKELLHRYQNEMTVEQKKLIIDFIAIENSSWFKSKLILLRHKILKQDFIRNIGLFVCR